MSQRHLPPTCLTTQGRGRSCGNIGAEQELECERAGQAGADLAESKAAVTWLCQAQFACITKDAFIEAMGAKLQMACLNTFDAIALFIAPNIWGTDVSHSKTLLTYILTHKYLPILCNLIGP